MCVGSPKRASLKCLHTAHPALVALALTLLWQAVLVRVRAWRQQVRLVTQQARQGAGGNKAENIRLGEGGKGGGPGS